MAFFDPKGEEIEVAILQGRRVAAYRWGTMWVSSRGAYVSFAWKGWLLVLGVALFVLFLVIRGG